MQAATETGSITEPEDAVLTGANTNNSSVVEKEPTKTEPTKSTTEITTEPVITPEQCAEITQKISEYGVEYDKFLEYLDVKILSDLPQSAFKMAVSGLESKRRHNETAAKKSATTDANEHTETQPPAKDNKINSMSEMLSALAVKSLSPQIDEDRGIIYVKIAFGDDANKAFLKENGFKWDAAGKMWKWSK